MIQLSIIIVNWNTKDLLIGCLDSIFLSKPKVKYEIIVVDNGSTDGSIKGLKNLKIIQNKRNFGFAKANNQGIKIAKGGYILLLNSDTQVKKGAIDTLYEFAKSDRNIGAVGARLLNKDGSVQSSCFNFPSLGNAIFEYWFNKKGLFGKYAPVGDKPVRVDAVVGAAFFITPQAREKAGTLDERYFFFYEDLDYCRKIKKANLKVYYLPKAEIIHYHGSTIRKITNDGKAWKKLIPGSKIYHGVVKHYILFLIMWLGQKWRKLFS